MYTKKLISDFTLLFYCKALGIFITIGFNCQKKKTLKYDVFFLS